MTSVSEFLRRRPFAAFCIVALALLVLRVAGLVFSDADLGPDEAQYWWWSRSPDFGYYSKPPFIAWAIAATTALFGDAEWAVRLSSPFFHAGTALFLFLAARRLYDGMTAFFAGAGWLVLPGTALSAALMTTDAPLLFFWSAALYFFFRTTEEGAGPRNAALLGAAVGLGFLSKYAMIYFPLGVAAALVLAPSLRRKGLALHLGLAAAIAALLVAPNIAWNAAHDFSTLAHTADNANIRGFSLRPLELLEFWAAQAGILGPVLAALALYAVATLKRRLTGPTRGKDVALLAIAAAPLLVVSIGALLSRAHGNWAATAYPSLLLVLTAFILRSRLAPAITATTALHGAIALAFLAAFSDFALIDRLGLPGATRPVRGWAEQVAEIRLEASGFDAIVVDDREVMAEILYYGRGGPPVFALNSNNRIDNHFEMTAAYAASPGRRALLVDRSPSPAAAERFTATSPRGAASAPLGAARPRILYLFEIAD